MKYTLAVTSQQADAVLEAIQGPLRAYNLARAGPSDSEPIVVVLTDRIGQPHGGAWGYTYFGWLNIRLMSVPEEARGRGLGREIMALAESTAVQRRCHGSWLETHGFQAKGFYEKLGYELFGELPNYPPPFSRFFFMKHLAATGASSAA